MPALRRRNKLVIPQDLSDPAPDKEVASRVLALGQTDLRAERLFAHVAPPQAMERPLGVA
jgi:hypothetical protein